MIMAMLMMGLAAAAGVWMSAATTMVITGFISVKGKGRKRRTARLVMMMMLTAVAAWVTVGSGGGDRNDGAIGGLVMPGMHPIGTQNETEYEGRPGIVHTMTFVGHVGERPLVVGFDTFSELDVVRKSVVDSKWRVLDNEGIGVHGVGEARFGKLLEMPIRYRYMSAETVLQVRVADDKHMPTGVDVSRGIG